MGSWDETCGCTQLPISSGDKIRAFILLNNTAHRKKLEAGGTCYADSEWTPFGISIQGEYDSYGGIENIIENTNTNILLESLKKNWMVDEDAKHNNIPTTEKLTLADALNAIERNCARYIVREKHLQLGLMYVLEDVYQTMMSFNPVESYFYDDASKNYGYKPVKDAFKIDLENWYNKLLKNSNHKLFYSDLNPNTLLLYNNNKMVTILKEQVVSLILLKTPFEDPLVQNLIESMWEIVHFNEMMISSRKLWHPQSGKGSQYNDLEIYKKIQNTVSEIILKREKEYEEENPGEEKRDENGFYPYMLEHNLKVQGK